MKILDIKTWDLLGGLGVATFVLAALVLALNQALVDAPAVVKWLPSFISSSGMAYVPISLFSVTALVVLVRAFRGRRGQGHSGMLTYKISGNRLALTDAFEPVSEFKLLPQRFSIDFSAQLPYVEVRFYAINFLPRAITLNHVKLTLQISGAPALELIPLVQDDPTVDPKRPLIVSCRRALLDAEFRAYPEKFGYESASFSLTAKATDGGKVLVYGPVSSMVIDGWVIPSRSWSTPTT